MPTYKLMPHPDHPPLAVEAVTVRLEWRGDGDLRLEYAVMGASALVTPKRTKPARADGLWKRTCFELFAKAVGSEAYREFNFSPSSEWAAYGFGSYRSAMTELAAYDPEIQVTCDAEPNFFLVAKPSIPEMVAGRTTFGISAVIEERGGSKSYWALAHALGPPDFHNPACFVATLPAPDAA